MAFIMYISWAIAFLDRFLRILLFMLSDPGALFVWEVFDYDFNFFCGIGEMNIVCVCVLCVSV